MGRFHLLGCYFGSGKALAKTIAGTAYGALVGWVALLIIVNVPMPALGVVRPASAAGRTPNLLIEVSPVLPRGACEGPRMKRAFWLLVPLIVLRTQAAELYRLDAGNTKVSLDVRLFGLPWLSVHFGDVSGEFVPDRQPSASRMDVTVLTASLACENPQWNARLLSEE